MKKFIFLIFILAIPLQLLSQEIEWQNTIGGSLVDGMEVIRQTSDGGYICAGMSESDISGDKTENCRGDIDYWIVKLDGTGNVEWDKTLGGDSIEFIYAIDQTSDGGYICGGTSFSGISGDKTEINEGYNDYWIVKLDPTGEILWQNNIGGNSIDELRSIMQTSDGGYICGGWSGSDSCADKSENSTHYDYWVIKLDSIGNIIWDNTIGGSYQDQLYAILETPDGGFICGGWSASDASYDKTDNSEGLNDFWVLKLDANGTILWQNGFGGSQIDELYSINLTNDGGFICGGFSKSDISGDKTENNNGLGDFWIVKLDSVGNLTWQNTIGGNDQDILRSIQQTNDGGYITTGSTWSEISGDVTEDASLALSSAWILRLDEKGHIIWQNLIGGNGFETGTSILQTSDGGYICGAQSGSDISGDKSENSEGLWDMWVVKLKGNNNLIQGTQFIDLNSNNILDTGELPVPGNIISESVSGRYAISQQDGFYSLSVNDTGTYQVFPSGLNYYTCNPVSETAFFPGQMQVDSLNDFAFQPTGAYNDLCLSIIPYGQFRVNQISRYRLHYYNQGTTALVPTIVFYPDSNVSFVSSYPSPSFVAQDSITFSAGLLQPFQSGVIDIGVNVNIGTPFNTLINSTAIIYPVAGDAYPSCNQDGWEVYSIASMDPNDILVNRSFLYTAELSPPPYLEYIIRFQNTGNDTAFFVKIENKIPDMLQLSEFEFVSASHPYNIQYESFDSTMKFTFTNILLPDSNINEAASHGFIKYRIKPYPALAAGDSIRNSARIIFDYNAPVYTNVAVTEILEPVGLPDPLNFTGNSIYLSPNPGSAFVNIKTGQPVYNATINVLNVLGEKIFSGNFNVDAHQSHNLDIRKFESGIYFITIENDHIRLTEKMVKH